MTSQGSSATASEKIVLDGFNTKLAAKINSWKATVSGVSIVMPHYLSNRLTTGLYPDQDLAV